MSNIQTIDAGLETKRDETYSKIGILYDDFIVKLGDAKITYGESNGRVDYNKRFKTCTLFHTENNLGENPQWRYQLSYLKYLETCWNRHFGVVVTPDIIWYTVLNELAGIVKADPETYRALYTKAPEGKVDIIVEGSGEVLPLHLITAKLEELVPTDIDNYLPSFSTTTDRAKDAQRAAFCELVSPFYNYMMMACGIPRYDIRGTERDWIELGQCWQKVSEHFPAFSQWTSRVSEIFSEIVLSFNNQNEEFWKSMFYSRKCGSGGEQECFGWFTELFLQQPKHVRKSDNFSSHVSTVEYKHLDLNRAYVMKQGLFISEDQDDFLVPEFGRIVYEKRAPETVAVS